MFCRTVLRRILPLALLLAGGAAYAQLPGGVSESDFSNAQRSEGWRADLKVLAEQLPEHHVNMFFALSEEQWRRAVEELARHDLDRRSWYLADAGICRIGLLRRGAGRYLRCDTRGTKHGSSDSHATIRHPFDVLLLARRHEAPDAHPEQHVGMF